MDDNLRLAADALARFLDENPTKQRTSVYITEWKRGFLDVCRYIDEGSLDFAKRTASEYPSPGYDDGRDYALYIFDIESTIHD